MLVLEILEWVFLIAAIAVMFFQFSARSGAQYNYLNSIFWVLMAAAFFINGLESDTGWMWFWYVGATACLVAAFVAPSRGRQVEIVEEDEE